MNARQAFKLDMAIYNTKYHLVGSQMHQIVSRVILARS